MSQVDIYMELRKRSSPEVSLSVRLRYYVLLMAQGAHRFFDP